MGNAFYPLSLKFQPFSSLGFKVLLVQSIYLARPILAQKNKYFITKNWKDLSDRKLVPRTFYYCIFLYYFFSVFFAFCWVSLWLCMRNQKLGPFCPCIVKLSPCLDIVWLDLETGRSWSLIQWVFATCGGCWKVFLFLIVSAFGGEMFQNGR